MNETTNHRKRYIYSFEFSDNHVYIGLTYKINKRKNQHLSMVYNNKHSKSSVYEYIEKSRLNPDFKILTKEPLNELDAINAEIYYINEYKKNDWILLNKIKGGSLGGNNLIWSYEKCKEEALKYKTKSEFNCNNASAYCSALKYGWLNEITSHMVQTIRKPKGYWTKELIYNIALQYSNRKDFKIKSGGAYSFAWKNNFIDEVCDHMIEKRKPNGYWTKDRCKEEALKYNSKTEFNNKNYSALNIATKNKWLDEICQNMVPINKPKNFWNYENCYNYALKYSNKSDFKYNCSGGFSAAKRNNWLNKICSHMIGKQKPNGYWTLENCKLEALKYEFRSEFRKKSNHVYNISRNNGFMDEICSHMPKRKERTKKFK